MELGNAEPTREFVDASTTKTEGPHVVRWGPGKEFIQGDLKANVEREETKGTRRRDGSKGTWMQERRT